MPKTYNEVLQRILSGYHKAGYSCVAVLRKGPPSIDVYGDEVYTVVLRQQLLNQQVRPLLRVSGALDDHESIIRRAHADGNILMMQGVSEYDGKE